jgi:hypothetical protein
MALCLETTGSHIGFVRFADAPDGDGIQASAIEWRKTS